VEDFYVILHKITRMKNQWKKMQGDILLLL
jgi:hypothetical protein